jgi:poly(A) polymerase
LDDALAIMAGEPRPVVLPEAEAALRRYARGEDAVPAFPLRGADFLARGVPKGPRIGELLARARLLWLTDGCPTDRAARDRLLEQALAEEPA